MFGLCTHGHYSQQLTRLLSFERFKRKLLVDIARDENSISLREFKSDISRYASSPVPDF